MTRAMSIVVASIVMQSNENICVHLYESDFFVFREVTNLKIVFY